MCRASETPIERMKAALADFPGWLAQQRDAAALGEPLIAMGEVVDRCEAGRAELLRRFEKSGAWQAEGALSVVAWLRWKCKLSGGAAAERVGSPASWSNSPRPSKPSAGARWGTSTWR